MVLELWFTCSQDSMCRLAGLRFWSEKEYLPLSPHRNCRLYLYTYTYPSSLRICKVIWKESVLGNAAWCSNNCHNSSQLTLFSTTEATPRPAIPILTLIFLQDICHISGANYQWYKRCFSFLFSNIIGPGTQTAWVIQKVKRRMGQAIRVEYKLSMCEVLTTWERTNLWLTKKKGIYHYTFLHFINLYLPHGDTLEPWRPLSGCKKYLIKYP